MSRRSSFCVRSEITQHAGTLSAFLYPANDQTHHNERVMLLALGADSALQTESPGRRKASSLMQGHFGAEASAVRTAALCSR